MATITITTRGQYTHGIPRHVGGSTFRRHDTYTAKDGYSSGDSFFAASSRDDSPHFDGRYDGERCSCCYLNFAHTTACHEAHVINHNAAVARHELAVSQ